MSGRIVLELAFWLLLVLAGYSYFLYPVLLIVLPKKSARGIRLSSQVAKRITVIIAARNEAANIRRKLDNTLALEVPGVELEIIVASDASDDDTDLIVGEYGTHGVSLVRSSRRLGKEVAQKLAIEASNGDILVFTDVGTTIPSGSLERLVECFSAPDIGAVSSVDRVVTDDGRVQGEGLYVRYEMLLRRLEGRFNTLVGLSGSFFAARRQVCDDWDTRVPSDFGTALSCARMGLRAVSDDSVIGYYRNLADPTREFSRKLRTATRGMAGLIRRREVLNPFKYGWFSFQVASHKVMRWGVPWFLALGTALAWALAPSAWFYLAIAMMLTCLLALPLLSRLAPVLRRLPLAGTAVFFVEANLALAIAAVRVVSGQTIPTWDPSVR